MTEADAVRVLLSKLIRETKDPFMGSLQILPYGVLNKILCEFVKNPILEYVDNALVIKLGLDSLQRQVEGALKRDVVYDEVGLLIAYGASKAVINEVIGKHPTEIGKYRKHIDNKVPSMGRPKKVDEEDEVMIRDMWLKVSANDVSKLLRIHIITHVQVNLIWDIVKPRPAQSNTITGPVSNVHKHS